MRRVEVEVRIPSLRRGKQEGRRSALHYTKVRDCRIKLCKVTMRLPVDFRVEPRRRQKDHFTSRLQRRYSWRYLEISSPVTLICSTDAMQNSENGTRFVSIMTLRANERTIRRTPRYAWYVVDRAWPVCTVSFQNREPRVSYNRLKPSPSYWNIYLIHISLLQPHLEF